MNPRRFAAALAAFLVLPAAAQEAATWTEPVTGMRFVHLSGGCFPMGTRETVAPSASLDWQRIGFDGDLAADEKPQHEVCVSPFWIAVHEVTVADWRRIVGRERPAAGDERLPVGGIDWRAAAAFGQRLADRSPGDERFRLPTEAEWEYACRALPTKSGGDRPAVADLQRVAVYGGGRARIAAEPVGSRAANAWGLHDLLGNVWEWVADPYVPDAYRRHALTDPLAKGGDGRRAIRGGSYRSEANQIRCANRAHYDEGGSLPQIGFRLVMTGRSPILSTGGGGR